LVYVPLPWNLESQHVTWLFEQDYAVKESSTAAERNADGLQSTRTFQEYSEAVVLPFTDIVPTFLFYGGIGFILLVLLLCVSWLLSCCCGDFCFHDPSIILDTWGNQDDYFR